MYTAVQTFGVGKFSLLRVSLKDIRTYHPNEFGRQLWLPHRP